MLAQILSFQKQANEEELHQDVQDRILHGIAIAPMNDHVFVLKMVIPFCEVHANIKELLVER